MMGNSRAADWRTRAAAELTAALTRSVERTDRLNLIRAAAARQRIQITRVEAAALLRALLAPLHVPGPSAGALSLATDATGQHITDWWCEVDGYCFALDPGNEPALCITTLRRCCPAARTPRLVRGPATLGAALEALACNCESAADQAS